MEPVTHFLAGACIGRAGLNRRTAYATLAGRLLTGRAVSSTRTVNLKPSQTIGLGNHLK